MATLTISQTWDGEPIDEAERAIVSLAAYEAGWRIEVDAPFHGDPPPPAPPGALEGLWNFEVVELFVAAVADSEGAAKCYTEVELSPHGHHLILRFAGVRRREARLRPLATHCVISSDRWHGQIDVPRDALPPQPWRANAFAMHGLKKNRRYLAATPLPGTQPDFHQPGLFPRLEVKKSAKRP